MPREGSPWILAAAIFNFALALFHVGFWRLFRWPQTLKGSGAVNPFITQVLNLALTYLFAVAGLLCLFFPGELAGTALGQFWLLAMAGFWLARAIIQPIFFGLGHSLSIVLLVVFTLGAIIHGASWFAARGI